MKRLVNVVVLGGLGIFILLRYLYPPVPPPPQLVFTPLAPYGASMPHCPREMFDPSITLGQQRISLPAPYDCYGGYSSNGPRVIKQGETAFPWELDWKQDAADSNAKVDGFPRKRLL